MEAASSTMCATGLCYDDAAHSPSHCPALAQALIGQNNESDRASWDSNPRRQQKETDRTIKSMFLVSRDFGQKAELVLQWTV